MKEMTAMIEGKEFEKMFLSFGISASFNHVDNAPQILTYHFNLKNLQDFYKIKKYIKLLELRANTSIVQVASKSCDFALEIKKQKRQVIETIRQGSIMKQLAPYSIFFGADTNNTAVFSTIQELPHLLVAGTTGSGKSVALNSYIMELCCYNKPKDLGVVLIDLKMCEFNVFKNLPHLIYDVVNDSKTAEIVLLGLCYTMEDRYKEMARLGLQKNNGHFQPIVVVIDELTDLVLQSTNCRKYLVQLLQKARACDIHIICATQSPRAKVLDGLLLANLPSRIALTCASSRESVLILGHKGAESLTGCGDAILKLNNSIQERRIQIPYIDNKTILKLLNY